MATYDEGLARGEHWAKHAAGLRELQALQALRVGKSADGWQDWFVGQDAGQTAFKRIVQTLRPETTGSAAEVAGFWRAAVAFDANTPQRLLRDVDFVRGFAEGALEILRQSGGAGERGSESPDEDWLDQHGGPSSENDT
jgi:hypothetical protein